MSIFKKKIGPVFLKEESDAVEYVEKLKELVLTAPEPLQIELDNQIKIASYGIAGENNIAYELKNSGIDMYVLHDIYLECGDMCAQIDYLVITRKLNYILECKNLIGNIEIDNKGAFVRTYEVNGKKVTEGIYSPITQNERHMRVVHALREQAKNNPISKLLFNKNFESNYKSLVVLANPKTVLHDKFAKKEIKQQVIRADQLIETIRRMDAESDMQNSDEKTMLDIANFFLTSSKPNKSDYIKKYNDLVTKQSNVHSSSCEETNSDKVCPMCGGKLIVREAKKGPNVGNEFWGCSNYPKCKFIENII